MVASAAGDRQRSGGDERIEGVGRLLEARPSAIVVVGYGAAFYLLALTLDQIRSASPMRSGRASASCSSRSRACCCSAKGWIWRASSASASSSPASGSSACSRDVRALSIGPRTPVSPAHAFRRRAPCVRVHRQSRPALPASAPEEETCPRKTNRCSPFWPARRDARHAQTLATMAAFSVPCRRAGHRA